MEPGQLAGGVSTGTVLLALGSWLAALLMGGLMTAHYRVMGLHRNGLLDEARAGAVLGEYLARPRRFQVTVSTLYLGLTILGSAAVARILAGLWRGEPDWKFLVLFVLLTLLLWNLGGLVFKKLAGDTAVAYARSVGTVVFPLAWVLRPWSTLMLRLLDKVDDTLWMADLQTHLSAGEIRSLLSNDGEGGSLDEDDREMIQSIFTFHDTAVREIMIPRIDMVVLDSEAPAAEILDAAIASGHSRIPVHQGSVDKIAGILYVKDLLKLVHDDRFQVDAAVLKDLVRPAYFIPESKKIDEVLDEFRSQRIHMAVVIDEYGGTAGLVTLEDVIEEIVGEIEDEFDEEEELLVWVDAQTVRLDPKINLEDLEEKLGIDLTAAEGAETSETLGGLIYEAAGNVPVAGDRIEVAGLDITVEAVEDQRIMRILLRSPQVLPGFARREEV
jgi:CBS domain containing-hemolysin-like protein